MAWRHASQAVLSPKSGQKELQAAEGQPMPAKWWDHIVPLLPLPELVHVCLEDSLICNRDAVKYLCILLSAYTTSLPLAYAMGRHPQTYHYKRPHGGTRTSIMAQLSRKRGRPLPKCACRGWGDALPQLPGLVDISQVFWSLTEQSWWLERSRHLLNNCVLITASHPWYFYSNCISSAK